VNQKIAKLCSAVEKTNTLLVSQTKFKRLQLASSRTEYGAFEYYANNSSSRVNSSILVKQIINWFVLGFGCHLPVGAYVEENNDENKVLFREKIKKQVQNLIEREPRLRLLNDGDGKFPISYS